MSDSNVSSLADYESVSMLDEYLLFHYGSEHEVLPNDRVWPAGMAESIGFPVRTVSYFAPCEVARGLDLGCAVGRSSLEMARHCQSVIGIDYSASFIDAAEKLGRGEAIPYRRLEESHHFTQLQARAPSLLPLDRVSFEQGDAMLLREDLGAFDWVHAANLLCRLADPVRLLKRLPSLVVPGGELVLATPCTWLDAYTPPERWPRPSTRMWLEKQLDPEFELTLEAEEPFLIRETARKFQWSWSMLTIWKRR